MLFLMVLLARSRLRRVSVHELGPNHHTIEPTAAQQTTNCRQIPQAQVSQVIKVRPTAI